MSKEILLSHPCPHMSVDERVILGSDRRSLSPKQSIASDNSIYILMNDEFYVPRNGLYSQAEIYSAVSGPFKIISGYNSVTITSTTETASIDLPVGDRIETDQIVKKINSSGLSSILARNFNGHLSIIDTVSYGYDSMIRISGFASIALGFDGQNGSRGREVYPGWDTVRSGGIYDTIKSIMFRSPVMGNPFIKVSYAMPSDRCLRCNGSLTENDWRYGEDGEPILIENEDLLYQAAMKIVLTSKNSNVFHSWYGSNMKSRVGMKSTGLLASMINEDVRGALENLQKLQLEQAKYQKVSYKERLYQISSVQTKQHNTDPTVFLVDVYVRNASQETVNISVVFTVPGVLSTNSSRNISIGRV